MSTTLSLYNSLTHIVEPFEPLVANKVALYSCGPTIYDYAHIGNLSSFIWADVLRRTLSRTYTVNHVMNFTDVDDKTIKRSLADYPDREPHEALKALTSYFEEAFKNDIAKIGVDQNELTFVAATENIDAMQQLITRLYERDIAYVADDGVYFSIEAYKQQGGTYGQLIPITAQSTGRQRVENDEYDKNNIHDFALWKKSKTGEPSWPFELAGTDMEGRPGWHIECSAMAMHQLGETIDIHTGGVDLKFPHHENEMAQSSGASGKPFVRCFLHSEHLLVENKKMSKRYNNFFTLRDIEERAYEPLAFRLLVLQSRYRHQLNFTWETLAAAQQFLSTLRGLSARLHQPVETDTEPTTQKRIAETEEAIISLMQDDLDSPRALAALSELKDALDTTSLNKEETSTLNKLLTATDQLLGLGLLAVEDIDGSAYNLIQQRDDARNNGDYAKADALREQLKSEHNVDLNDTPFGTLWAPRNIRPSTS